MVSKYFFVCQNSAPKFYCSFEFSPIFYKIKTLCNEIYHLLRVFSHYIINKIYTQCINKDIIKNSMKYLYKMFLNNSANDYNCLKSM